MMLGEFLRCKSVLLSLVGGQCKNYLVLVNCGVSKKNNETINMLLKRSLESIYSPT